MTDRHLAAILSADITGDSRFMAGHAELRDDPRIEEILRKINWAGLGS